MKRTNVSTTEEQDKRFWELVKALGLPSLQELKQELRVMKKFNSNLKKTYDKV